MMTSRGLAGKGAAADLPRAMCGSAAKRLTIRHVRPCCSECSQWRRRACGPQEMRRGVPME
jgi:hypothetical protein